MWSVKTFCPFFCHMCVLGIRTLHENEELDLLQDHGLQKLDKSVIYEKQNYF